MPVDIAGVNYYLYDAFLVVDSTGAPVISTDVDVTAGDGSAVTVRDPVTQAVIASPATSVRGILQSLLVDATSIVVGAGDVPFSRTTSEVAGLVDTADDARVAAEAAQAAAEAAQAAAEVAEGPPGPPGTPYPIVTYTGSIWPARPAGVTGPVFWEVPPGTATYPGDPADLQDGDYMLVPDALDPS